MKPETITPELFIEAAKEGWKTLEYLREAFLRDKEGKDLVHYNEHYEEEIDFSKAHSACVIGAAAYTWKANPFKLATELATFFSFRGAGEITGINNDLDLRGDKEAILNKVRDLEWKLPA